MGPLPWRQEKQVENIPTTLPAPVKYNPIVIPKPAAPTPNVMYNPLSGFPGYHPGNAPQAPGSPPIAAPLQMPHNLSRRNQMLGMMPPFGRQSTTGIMSAKPPATIPKMPSFQGPKQAPFPAPKPPNVQPRLRPRLT